MTPWIAQLLLRQCCPCRCCCRCRLYMYMYNALSFVITSVCIWFVLRYLTDAEGKFAALNRLERFSNC